MTKVRKFPNYDTDPPLKTDHLYSAAYLKRRADRIAKLARLLAAEDTPPAERPVAAG
jgi:hypothetical protein